MLHIHIKVEEHINSFQTKRKLWHGRDSFKGNDGSSSVYLAISDPLHDHCVW